MRALMVTVALSLDCLLGAGETPKGIDVKTAAALDMAGVVWSKGYYGMPRIRIDPSSEKLPEVPVPFELNLCNRNVTAVELGRLAKVKHLAALTLQFSSMDDAKLEKLVAFDDLTTLGLYYSPAVTDEGMKHLAKVKKLAWLDLHLSSVTDAGMKHLAGAKNLASIDLTRTKVTGEGIRHLMVLKKLTRIEIDFPMLTDEVLRVLRRADRLHVVLDATAKDGKHARSTEEIARLNLYNSNVTDEGLKELTGLKGLTDITLTNSPVKGAGLRHLRACEALRSLGLSGTRIADEGLAHLAGYKNLAALDLEGTHVTDAGAKHLAACKSLTSLNLKGTKVTGAVVRQLRKALPRCKVLEDHADSREP